MASSIGDLVATLGVNNRPFVAGLAGAQTRLRTFSVGVVGTLGKIRGAFRGLAGLAGFGGLFTAAGLLYGAKKAVEAAGIQTKAEKKLQAVLMATGGAAGFTAKELFAYAAGLQKVTNWGDETTISAMGILATFRAVNGDVFKEAISLSQDMASVMEEDLNSAVVRVGKALQDPIRGLTALRRVGVMFTDQQAAQIKAMAQSGDMLGAQKMILAELQAEFGGASRGMVSPLTQAKNAFGDLMETIGRVVKPAFVGIASGVQTASEWMQTWESRARATFSVIGTVGGMAWRLLMRSMRGYYDLFVLVFDSAQKFVANVFGGMVANNAMMVNSMLKSIDTILGSWEGLRDGIILIWTQTLLGVQSLWDTVKTEIAKGLISIAPGMSQEDRDAAIGILNSDHQRKMEEIGRASIKSTDDWIKSFGKRPTLSGRVSGAWYGALAGAPGLPIPAALGLGGGGAIGGIAAKKDRDELPKALEQGTSEAWSKIMQATYGSLMKDKTNERIAAGVERTARGVEQIAAANDEAPEF